MEKGMEEGVPYDLIQKLTIFLIYTHPLVFLDGQRECLVIDKILIICMVYQNTSSR
jgi:hypothetical protein